MNPEFNIVYPTTPINKKYEIGLVITTFDRPYYLHRTLASLRKSNLENTVILIVDDKSGNTITLDLLERFELENTAVIKAYRTNKDGWRMYENLRFGWDFLLRNFNCTYLCNLDPDALVQSFWLSRLKEACNNGTVNYGGCLITGFNAHQHSVLEEKENHYIKKSAGGINFFFTQKIYLEIVKPLLDTLAWDFRVGEAAEEKNYPIICTKPSVVQHLGRGGIWSNPRNGVFDFASDFGDTNPLRMKFRLFYYEKSRIYGQKIFGFFQFCKLQLNRIFFRIFFRKLY